MKIISIIPTFNREKELNSLLYNLYKLEKPNRVNFEIICVVDGSSDGTNEMLLQNFPKVHVVKGDGNWWYTKSINEGLKRAEPLNPDLVLLLNDDISLPNNYLINIYQAHISKGPESIIGSVSFTMNQPYRITNSGVKQWNKLLDKTKSYFPFLSQVDPSEISGIFPTSVLPGRGMLVPWKVLQKLNYFDESFLQYQSDFDFTLRAKKAGFPVYISWDAQVFSYVEKTASGSSFLKTSTKTVLKNFFNPYSRIYIPNRSRYYWRHYYSILWPWYMTKFITLTVKNHFFKRKMILL